MPSLIINVKAIKKYAFCKNWYDPTNSAIEPKNPAMGIWKIKDINQKCLCLKRNIPMSANAFCGRNFEFKI